MRDDRGLLRRRAPVQRRPRLGFRAGRTCGARSYQGQNTSLDVVPRLAEISQHGVRRQWDRIRRVDLPLDAPNEMESGRNRQAPFDEDQRVDVRGDDGVQRLAHLACNVDAHFRHDAHRPGTHPRRRDAGAAHSHRERFEQSIGKALRHLRTGVIAPSDKKDVPAATATRHEGSLDVRRARRGRVITIRLRQAPQGAVEFHAAPPCWASNAARVAMVTMRETESPSRQTCTGRARPTRIGPTTATSPSAWTSFVEMAAEWMAGMTSTLAGSLRRWNG